MKYSDEYLKAEEDYTKAELTAFYNERSEENREAILKKREEFAAVWDKKIVEEAPYHPGYEDAAFAPPPAKISVEQRILEAYQKGYTAGWYAAQADCGIKGDGGNH